MNKQEIPGSQKYFRMLETEIRKLRIRELIERDPSKRFALRQRRFELQKQLDTSKRFADGRDMIEFR